MSSEVKCEVSVKAQGEAPNRAYQAHLQIGNQGFDIEPLYLESADEDARGSAEWMVSMVHKAIGALVASSGGCTVGIVQKYS